AATDFSSLAGIALDTAGHIAGPLHADRIHVLHVIRDPASHFPSLTGDDSSDVLARLSADADEKLQALPYLTTRATVTRAARVGIPAREIALEAGETGADLIVLGSHGYGSVKRLFLGSVTQDLVRVSPAPVLVVGAGWDPSRAFRRVIAALDVAPVS